MLGHLSSLGSGVKHGQHWLVVTVGRAAERTSVKFHYSVSAYSVTYVNMCILSILQRGARARTVHLPVCQSVA